MFLSEIPPIGPADRSKKKPKHQDCRLVHFFPTEKYVSFAGTMLTSIHSYLILLQDEPLVSLLRAARAMDQLEFLHGATGQRR